MKKALFTLAMSASTVSLALAQINIGLGAQQGQVNVTALYQLINAAQNIVTALVPFAIGAALLAFFWYLIKFILNPSADNKKQSLQGMGYSILALFVMVSIWGIIGLLGSLVGVNQGGQIPVPVAPRLQ